MTVYTHPGQSQMQVEVILASKGANGAPPLYTMRLRYPRVIHAEVETHRIMSSDGVTVEVHERGYGIMSDPNLSRNARSSRAVPVKTMLNEVRTIPFIPWHWGKNQKGMQAGEECNEPIYFRKDVIRSVDMRTREEAWLYARDTAVEVAEAMMNAGYHKQIPNRLLEPFSWIDTLISATNWNNFLHLRDHKDAEPHLQDLARLVKQAINEAEVQVLEEGEWHLPYITDKEYWEFRKPWRSVEVSMQELAKLSAARCARISYAPFDGDASYERELERYDSLVKSDRVHASPLEHQAKVDREDPDEPNTGKWEHAAYSGNFDPGWIQYRKMVPGESFRG